MIRVLTSDFASMMIVRYEDGAVSTKVTVRLQEIEAYETALAALPAEEAQP